MEPFLMHTHTIRQQVLQLFCYICNLLQNRCSTSHLAKKAMPYSSLRAKFYPQMLSGYFSRHTLPISHAVIHRNAVQDRKLIPGKQMPGKTRQGSRREWVRARQGKTCIQSRAENKWRGSKHLVIDSLLQKVLVGPQAAVCGGQLLLQARWGQLIQPRGKPGQVVSAHHTTGKVSPQNSVDGGTKTHQLDAVLHVKSQCSSF